MVDDALGHAEHPPAAYAEPPAEVYLFVVGKEAAIETAHLFIITRAHEECRSGGPQCLGRLVVLSVVGLHGVEEPSATERIAVAVDVAAAGASIFERVAMDDGAQLRLTGCGLGVAVHEGQQGRQPVGRHLDVAVQQQVVLRVDLRQRLVVAVGETPVFLQHDEPTLGKLRLQQRQAVVGRSVVSHIDVGLAARVLQHAGQILAQHRCAVPVEYDDGKTGHGI